MTNNLVYNFTFTQMSQLGYLWIKINVKTAHNDILFLW